MDFQNFIIFGVDYTSSFHNDNQKTNFRIIFSGCIGTAEQKFNFDFTEQKTKFCMSLHYNDDNSCLFVNNKKSCKLKAYNKNVDFFAQFYLGNISEKFKLPNLEKYHLKKMYMIFQLIIILLISLTY